MEERDSEVPLAVPPLTVGILYNLKCGAAAAAPDAEAEFDSMDTVRAIQSALEEGGARTVLMEADASLPERLKDARIDVAFNIAEGIGGRGREAQVPALLALLGIPHTGSDETTLCLALDKALTKRILATYRVRMPRSVLVKCGETPRPGRLRYPVIVKPNAEGSSKGISDASVAETPKELRALLEKNFALYGADMLVEEYIEGREFTVGLLGNDSSLQVFEPMEIIYRRPTQGAYHVYSYPVKQNYRQYVDYACPASLSDAQRGEMKNTARRVFQVLGCRDFARADFRLAEDGRLYFIEINPLPGLAPHYSDYPMLAEFCGVSHGDLVRAVLSAALARCGIRREVSA
ncbi:MAG TPA: ATP-grasp domain-containing protein [Oscillospiraceae bacterium]|nr:ATP-grasp domain-containing protein [Oscillospiraceae bacterium]